MLEFRKLHADEFEGFAVKLAKTAGKILIDKFAMNKSRNSRAGAHEFCDLEECIVDQDIENVMKAMLQVKYPEHTVVGEETGIRRGLWGEPIWVLDPLDGSDNFVSGFPLFAASVGVLSKGRVVAGAIWCSIGHELVPGVYHAHEGGPVMYEGKKLPPRRFRGVHKGMSANLSEKFRLGVQAKGRRTGSAAMECVFLSIGILQVAHFTHVKIWDVAGGIALANAAGLTVREKREFDWQEFKELSVSMCDGSCDLGELLVGEIEFVRRLVEMQM